MPGQTVHTYAWCVLRQVVMVGGQNNTMHHCYLRLLHLDILLSYPSLSLIAQRLLSIA